MTAMALP